MLRKGERAKRRKGENIMQGFTDGENKNDGMTEWLFGFLALCGICGICGTSDGDYYIG